MQSKFLFIYLFLILRKKGLGGVIQGFARICITEIYGIAGHQHQTTFPSKQQYSVIFYKVFAIVTMVQNSLTTAATFGIITTQSATFGIITTYTMVAAVTPMD